MDCAVYRRDCVKFKLLKNSKCPSANKGYCLDCDDYVPRTRDKHKRVKRQLDINDYFKNIVYELANAIIDEAVDHTYKMYRHYPQIQTIRIMRGKFQ